MSRIRPLAAGMVAAAALAVVAAGPVRPPDDLVREANEAVARGELDLADTLYQTAEERAADPGLIAYNRATLLYRRADYPRAEQFYRRALGDAAIPPDRRGRALYGLGNALVRQAGDKDLRRLQAAIDCYELVLREPAYAGLRADAGHNLEVAKLLWARAHVQQPPGERDRHWEDPDTPRDRPPEATDPPEATEPGDDGNGPKDTRPEPRPEPVSGPVPGTAPKQVAKTAPGAGNLPVLPDDGSVKAYDSPDEARTDLQWHAERIRRERQKLREEAVQGERPRANDW